MSEITVACLQVQAYDLDQAEDALACALERIDEAGRQQPDLMVLPECTYPAYYLQSLEAYYQASLRPHEEVVSLFAERARKHRCHLVVGIAHPLASGRLANAAYLFNPKGEVIGESAKSFLWHFDQNWFDPGNDYPTFDLPFGRVGMFVCADGRMPEVVRALSVSQPRLLIDATAWVTTGGERAALSNPQFEYIIPVRAIENGVWIAVANKVGVEAESIVYCGRSCIVAPDGQLAAQAAPDQEEIILASIDLEAASGPPLERRPECYPLLTRPTTELPVSRLLAEQVTPGETVVRVGLLQLRPYASAEAYLERAATLAERLVRQGTQLLVLPGIPSGQTGAAAYQAQNSLPGLLELSARLKCGLVAPLVSRGQTGQVHSAYLVVEGELLGGYRQTHFPAEQAGRFEAGQSTPVFETPYGRLGLMLNEEGLVPELARVLMLQGAELILWPAADSGYPLGSVASCRADENKVFVALATPLVPHASPQTALFGPSGRPLATALPDIEQAIAGQVAYAITRLKEMAPNTDVVRNRQPAAYGQLVR
jgi:predicted amidohydrolase